MLEEDRETFYPTSRLEWRQWLTEHHSSKQSVWLIQYKKKSKVATISWSEAVEEALCFGWVDSKRIPVDEEKFMQFFCRRKAKSTWSKINKDKVQQLINSGMMTPAGLESIAIAKQNGSWTILDDVEELRIPSDLDEAFASLAGSKEYFMSLSKSVKKMLLQWVVLAKRPDTRQQRINEIAEFASQKLKPKQFR